MKTVIDAVNEFKGDFNNGDFANTHNHGYKLTDNYIHMVATNEYTDQKIGSLVVYSKIEKRNDVDFICTRDEFNKCIEEMTNMNIKPVYTQAMADAGVMPSVGMECLINFPDIDNAWYEYTIDFMGKHVFIASCKDVSERFGHIEDVIIKPLTPPIELIGGECYQFKSPSGIIRKGYYIPVKGWFVCHNGNIEADRCTNIQLLEVKA